MTEMFEAGVLLVDKPAGKTSFAMIKVLRRLTGIRKIGHAGTLDPFATGLLVVCLERSATKMIADFMVGEKEYLATLQLGSVSTTQDPEGDISCGAAQPDYPAEVIEAVLDRFRGNISQKPPAFSALKHKGRPLYHYARQGISIEKSPRAVTIHQLEWLDPRGCVDNTQPELHLRVRCSKGTYIRALAEDIGQALGCGAYLTALRRIRSGFFSVKDSLPGSELYNDNAAALVQTRLLSVEHVRKLLQKDDGMDNIQRLELRIAAFSMVTRREFLVLFASDR